MGLTGLREIGSSSTLRTLPALVRCNKLREYTLGVYEHLGIAGAHSFHEVISVAEVEKLGYTLGDYRNILNCLVCQMVQSDCIHWANMPTFLV